MAHLAIELRQADRPSGRKGLSLLIGFGNSLGGVKMVSIYTDGACRGNPGRGGFGVILTAGSRRKELSGGFVKTTNNRMELMAAIAGLEALKEPCEVTVWSDSKYLVNAMTKGWLRGWKGKGWTRGPGKRLKNEDLWKRLDAVHEGHRVTWHWVKGHSGHAENERCDELAVEAADGGGRVVDQGYLREEQLEQGGSALL